MKYDNTIPPQPLSTTTINGTTFKFRDIIYFHGEKPLFCYTISIQKSNDFLDEQPFLPTATLLNNK